MATHKPLDYSKWENLELSDDEDTHPGAQFIEESTLRRMKRMTHERNESERAQKEQEARDRLAEVEEKLKHLELRKEQGEKFVNDKDTPVDDELAKAREQKQSEEEEIERLQKSKKVNADEACYVAQEKSVVGNSGSSSSAAASSTREDWENLSYEQFVEKYSGIIDDYLSRKRTLDSAEAFLSDYPMLLSEHALGYMLMQALNHGMREERQKMRRVVANKYHVKSLLDFARETNKHPQSLVEHFFERLRKSKDATQEYWRGYEDLFNKLEQRAQEKTREGDHESEEQEVELSREERLGPGGLDPVEVFKELPTPVQTAYEQRDTESLREYVNSMNSEEAREVMQKMVDSGLWVPNPQDPGMCCPSGPSERSSKQ